MPPKGYNKDEDEETLKQMGRNSKKQWLLDKIDGALENAEYWKKQLRDLLKEEAEEIKNKKRKGKQE